MNIFSTEGLKVVLHAFLWIDSLRTQILLPVPHRFWTFSIPKRLRPFFMHNRKLLSLMVAAANHALTAPLTGGNIIDGIRPGIIALIQTHSDSLDWNPHLHMIVTNGLVDYTNVKCPTFQAVKRWEGAVITEIFRWRLLRSLVKKNVITPEIADNMLSWPHSGFNVHATTPFTPDDAELVKNRLAYAFRPPVALNRLGYDGTTVILTTTKRKQLTLTPNDFLAKITLHIPDRYQNIRRYAGFYSPNIQRLVRLARDDTADSNQPAIDETKPISPKWAAMIAKIFGEISIQCPKCSTVMDLKEFVFDKTIIRKFFSYIPRAPPKLVLESHRGKVLTDYVPSSDEFVYSRTEDNIAETEIDQSRPETDDDFNQDLNW